MEHLSEHLSAEALDAGLDEIRRSPSDLGRVEMIVRRPAVDQRELLERAELDSVEGLVGDTWRVRPSKRMPDRSAHPEMQLTLMNSRVAALIAGAPERRALAGDQLYVDLDLSATNLPPGTLLRVGTAVIEVTDQPHTGCHKFAARFGPDALRFVNTPLGRELRLRGMNTRIVRSGTVRTRDLVGRCP
jgi:hypothetical protein